MPSKNKKPASNAIGPKQIAASLKLVQKAAEPFADIKTLNAKDRQRALKLKRGAKNVIGQIATIAQHFGVEAPLMPIDEMLSKMAYADELTALHTAVGTLYAQLGDEILRSQSDAWKTATVTYGMLRKAANGQAIVREQLASVEEWFRQSTRRAATKKSPATPAPAQPAKPNGTATNASPVTNGVASHVVS